MRKILICRVAGLLTLLLTMAAFVLAGSSVSYAASAHQAAVVPSGITVAENPLTEDTNGSFVGTVSGRGLHPNAAYVLTDNNLQCVDSINNAGSLTVTTDTVGRFSTTFLGGPSFFASASCTSGHFTVTATLAALPSVFMTTTFKLNAPTSFGTAHALTFNPNPAVISTIGAAKSTLYGKGWGPGKAFSVTPVTSPCTSITSSVMSPGGVVDGDGNFEVSITGFGCSAGPAKFLVTVGTDSRLITLHLGAPSL